MTKFPKNYPQRLREVSWVTDYAAGPKKRFKRANMFSSTSSYFKPLFHDEMLKDWFQRHGKNGLKYDNIVRYFISCFTVVFTEREGFHISEKHFKIEKFMQICKTNEETAQKLIDVMKDTSIKFYKNF